MDCDDEALSRCTFAVTARRRSLLDEWDERASIREYLGSVTRNEAESRSIDDIRAIVFRQTEII